MKTVTKVTARNFFDDDEESGSVQDRSALKTLSALKAKQELVQNRQVKFLLSNPKQFYIMFVWRMSLLTVDSCGCLLQKKIESGFIYWLFD